MAQLVGGTEAVLGAIIIAGILISEVSAVFHHFLYSYHDDPCFLCEH
jgi:hypothetical protein